MEELAFAFNFLIAFRLMKNTNMPPITNIAQAPSAIPIIIPTTKLPSLSRRAINLLMVMTSYETLYTFNRTKRRCSFSNINYSKICKLATLFVRMCVCMHVYAFL